MRSIRRGILLGVLLAGWVSAGCNYSHVAIPPGLSRDQVREAILRACRSQGYSPTVLQAPSGGPAAPDIVVVTDRHYCFRCGVWNGIWGFPLYWYRHRVDAFDTTVRIRNQGFLWNIWVGFVSNLLPIYSSGGLNESIRSELQRAGPAKAGGGP